MKRINDDMKPLLLLVCQNLACLRPFVWKVVSFRAVSCVVAQVYQDMSSYIDNPAIQNKAQQIYQKINSARALQIWRSGSKPASETCRKFLRTKFRQP